MIDNPELQLLADELEIRVVGPLTGGEFGAMLAVDRHERELVLKIMSFPTSFSHQNLASRFGRGARLARRLRANGYPAPEYVGSGEAASFAWSLQERLPGTLPDVMTAGHARRLVQLAAMHQGAAGESYDWRSWAMRRARDWHEPVSANDQAAPLAHELAAVVEKHAPATLREDDIVHADFHHRNYLAIDDEITGVFDWEFAMPGDWRVDLVTLAFWSAILPEQIPPEAAAIIVRAAFEACPPDVLAFLAAYQSLRQLDYDVRAHPEWVEQIVPAIQTVIAPWWRAAR